jgi:hypothetical protein
MNALPSNTQGGSPVRESRPPGFVRGALSNECPYRDRLQRVDVMFSIVYPDSDNELRPVQERRVIYLDLCRFQLIGRLVRLIAHRLSLFRQIFVFI